MYFVKAELAEGVTLNIGALYCPGCYDTVKSNASSKGDDVTAEILIDHPEALDFCKRGGFILWQLNDGDLLVYDTSGRIGELSYVTFYELAKSLAPNIAFPDPDEID